MWIKICGITRTKDAIIASMCGADAVGFVFAESSRRVNPNVVREIVRNMPGGPVRVGVFVDEEIEKVKEIIGYCSLDFAQLHGDESPEYCDELGGLAIKAIRLDGHLTPDIINSYRCPVMIDARLDRGDLSSLDIKGFIEGLNEKRIIIAGGLNPENVAEVISKLRPFGVDVSSGVESSPGKKDPILVGDFIKRARIAEYEVMKSGT
ncbi:MAG: phosphoribosylanthranilate isomerase [Actinomycetota bacterium]|nr:phosphoribosylanthranilate isomerase [Actinomycetota bacterium]